MKGRIRTAGLNRALTGAFITLLFAFSMSVRAAVPDIMNFQGKLTDSGGTAVTSTVPMTFKLYTFASGGAAVWTEVQSVTPDINGLYSVHLGEVTPFNIVFSTAYWLGVTVGTDGEMSPRYRLVSSPYALQASSSSWAEGVSWSGVVDKPSLNIFLSTSAFTALHASLPGVRISSGLIISNGNVGISTGAPQGRLDVLAAGSSAADMVQIWRRSDGVIVGSMSASGNMTAVKFLGDGSDLSGIVASSGDSLGTHVATTTLQMGSYGVNTTGNITAARYQISGSTVLAVLPGIGGLAVGINAGRVTTNDYNSFLGYEAGYYNTTGTQNSFLGYHAGYSNTLGNFNSFLGYRAGYSNTMGNLNTFLGYMAGLSNTTGVFNSFLGGNAGYSNTTGGHNSILGYEAGLYTKTGSANAIFGNSAGYGLADNSFSSSTIIGYRAGYGLTTGSNNILVGFKAGDNITAGSGNIVIGYDIDTTGPTANNELNIGGLIFGDLSAGRVGISTASPGATLHVNGQFKITDGSQGAGKVLTSDAAGNATWQPGGGGGDNLGSHVATTTLQMGSYGVNTSSDITAARYQIAGSTVLAVLPGVASLGVGLDAGRMNTGPYNSFLGYRAGYSNTTGWDNTFLGYAAGQSNTTGWDNTFLGRGAGYSNTTGDSNSFMGADAGFANTTGSSNSFLGDDAGYWNTTGNFNSIIGNRAGYSNTTGSSNSFFGYGAGISNTTGSSNSFLGFYAGQANAAGGDNSFLGYGAGYSNTTGNSNSFIGSYTGYYTRTGSANAIFGNAAGYGVLTNSFSSSTIMGYQAGYGLTTGSDNILLGFRAGYGITTGTGNIVIGYAKDTSAPAASNELNIGGLIYGDLSAGKVGIGTAGPQSSLHVSDGKYAQFEDNNAGAPPAADCDSDQERGRLSIDTSNNRLYICNGAARGWDYLALAD